jgi:outer membrane receptor for ferrienterochelin and colicins
LIAQAVDPTDQLLVFQNAQRIRARGLELGAEGKWQSGIQLRFGYAVQRTRDADTGLIIPNSPEHLAKSNLAVPLFKKKLFLGVEGQFMSSRQSLRSMTVGGFGTANITFFGRRLIKGLDMSAGIYNLFDKNYSDPAPAQNLQETISRDGRSIRIKLSYSF